MADLDYAVENCSERYKEYIRVSKYGDTVSKTTKENMIFLFDKKKYIVKFTLEYTFDFENGFTHTKFYDFKSNRTTNPSLMYEFIKCIQKNFVNTDRLSCYTIGHLK